MDLSETEKLYMEKAFKFAHQALRAQEVPVGCIFIFGTDIIASGRNTVNETKNATRHAEINCIDQVHQFCIKNNLRTEEVFPKVSVYVTVEPCIMCAAALFELQVSKIIYGCKNDRFGGETVLDVKGILDPVTDVRGGYRAEEAMELLKEFYKGTNPSAPLSKVKTKK